MLIEETSNSLTLVDGAGKHHVILRKDLEELIARGHTHMPERLEANLTPQQMADLFAFIRGTGPQTPAAVVHAPALVRPEADGSLRLLARQAEIRAVKVHFDGQQDCLVWHAGEPEDHIAWDSRSAQSRHVPSPTSSGRRPPSTRTTRLPSSAVRAG